MEGKSMTKRKFAIALVAMACSVVVQARDPKPTYQPATELNTPGFLTAPADGGRITVVYTGARGMSKKQVAEYAMLRAAEFTAESGQEWFAVIDTKAQKVQLVENKNDLKARGGFGAGESTGTGAGGAGAGASPRGTADSSTRGGPSTGGFGGGDVPYQALERWTPPSVHQTVLVIQMGKGDQASFAGVTKTPEIFPASTTAAEIRAKMKP
jgi:hypothetical protein